MECPIPMCRFTTASSFALERHIAACHTPKERRVFDTHDGKE